VLVLDQIKIDGCFGKYRNFLWLEEKLILTIETKAIGSISGRIKNRPVF